MALLTRSTKESSTATNIVDARFDLPKGRQRPGDPGLFRVVEGVRALAAFAVMVGHLAQISANNGLPFDAANRAPDVFLKLGQMGLAGFFAISAFVLFRPFVAAQAAGRPRPSLKRFAQRRAARMVPLYWCVLTVTILSGTPTGVGSAADGIRVYSFTQLFSERLIFAGVAPAWTLPVEVTFYFFVAGCAVLWARGVEVARATRILVPLCALSVIARSVLLIDPISVPGHTLIGCFTWFGAGMLAAIAFGHPEVPGAAARWMRGGSRWPVLSVIILVGACVVLQALPREGIGAQHHLRTLATSTALGASAFGIITLTLYGEHSRFLLATLGSRAGVWLGARTYGVYLWHFVVISQLARSQTIQNSSLPRLTVAVASIAITLLLADITLRLVEMPVVNWVRRRTASPRSVAT